MSPPHNVDFVLNDIPANNGPTDNEHPIKINKHSYEKVFKDVCNEQNLRARLPITLWLPSYTLSAFFQDLIAGITVGATTVAQGIAYALLAGLPPEYGLYSAIMGGFAYAIFGNCSYISIGPTSILSALIGKYVTSQSPDYAVLATFLAGIIHVALAIFQLGFLVEFISGPVVTGFTTAAAIQIATSQLKPLFGLTGPSGSWFATYIYNFFVNIDTAEEADAIFGVFTIFLLVVMKKIGQSCSRTDDSIWRKLRWFLSIGRNAVIVIFATIITYLLDSFFNEFNLTLIGTIEGGLPEIHSPFTTTIGNQTYSFTEMVRTLSVQSLVIPLVAVLEVVVIAKAFTPSVRFCASQEIFALGMCNIAGSFIGSIPVTGAFSRAAINKSSGAQTPATSIISSLIVILSLTLLTSTFYFIPKSTLAGMIIVAVCALIDLDEIIFIWKSSKREFIICLLTMLLCLGLGLEYGVILGVCFEIMIILYGTARPQVQISVNTIDNKNIFTFKLPEKAKYCSSEHLRKAVIKTVYGLDRETSVVLDGSTLISIDSSVACCITNIVDELEQMHFSVTLMHFKLNIQKKIITVNEKFKDKFVNK